MVADYIGKETRNPWRIRIYIEEADLREIRVGEDLTYVLTAKNGNEWTLNARVHGEIRPFSMTVSQLKAHETHDATSGLTVLTIRDHLFLHNRKFYMFGAAPKGRPLREFLVGKKYICRLDNFPLTDLTEINLETTERLRRFRGAPVGEYEGLGKEGHRVRLLGELEEIALPLAASCYLLYLAA